MSRCLLAGGAPVAAPFASSQDRRSPLWDVPYRRITPGALTPSLCVLLSLVGGWA
jgi:hypothetical protein